MSATATEATREELIAEFIVRSAVDDLHHAIRMTMEGEDNDVVAKLDSDGLMHDARYQELFATLWPDEEDTEGPEFLRANDESGYLAARMLRAIVYHSDDLRAEAQRLFGRSDSFRYAERAEEASDDA